MYIRRLATVLLFSCYCALSAASETAFRFVTVLSMHDESLLQDQTVLVRGDRIVAVGPTADIKLPPGARIIDARGQYLLPGLAEMHGHTPVPGGDVGHPQVADMMFLYIANGVTTVRGMLGAEGQLELQRLVREGQIEGPSLYLAGPSFSGSSISSPAQARRNVARLVEQGWDLLKVHPGLSRAEYDAMAEEAHRLGIRFAGHVPTSVGLEHALAMGQETFDHIDGYLAALGYPATPLDDDEVRRIAKSTRDSRAWVVPTLVLWDHIIGLGDPETLLTWPELVYWPSEQVAAWEKRQRKAYSEDKLPAREAYSAARSRVLKILADEGVGIMMGTDSPQVFSVPGFSIHREMAAMLEAGMSSYEVLSSGTRSVGEYLQGTAAVGVIAPGMRADLILLPDNPLENLSALARRSGVMVRGRWYSDEEINSRLKDIATRNKAR